jgi:hypothetical protein
VGGLLSWVEPGHLSSTVKQHLGCIRMLCDWLVTGQVMPTDPAHSVRGGPRHSVTKGVTTVLSSEEARAAHRDGVSVFPGFFKRGLDCRERQQQR